MDGVDRATLIRPSEKARKKNGFYGENLCEILISMNIPH